MERLIKNGGLMLVAKLATTLISFFNRRIFLIFLSVEYLGFESVFSNVLTLLSVADLGLETVIVTKLYHGVAAQDEDEINKLLYIFKWFYRIVSGIVLVGAILVSPFLPYIIQDAGVGWKYLYVVYALQVLAVIAEYFLSYRRALFMADQKGGICSLYDMCGKIITQGAQIAVLIIYPNYLLYLACKLCTAPLSNIFLKLQCDRQYPYTRNRVSVTLAELKSFNLFREGENFFIHKICSLVFNATDTIIISAFCGVVMAALYSNYLTVVSAVTGLFIQVPFNALQAAMGNRLQLQMSAKKKQEELDAFFLASGLYSTQIALGYFLFIQFLIRIWIGERYLLPLSVAFLFALIRGIVTMDYANGVYRNPAGEFYKDRNYVILAAIVNIVLSVYGAMVMGIEGVLLGTIVGQVVINFSHLKVIYQRYCTSGSKMFVLKQMSWPLLIIGEMALCGMLFKNNFADISILSFAAKVLLWAGLGIVNYLAFYRAAGSKTLRKYLKKIFFTIWARIKRLGTT